PQCCENAVDDDERPASLVQLFRCRWIDRFHEVALFCIVRLQRHRCRSAAALLRAATRCVVGQEVAKRCEEEGAKPAALLRQSFKTLPLEQRCKKRLRQTGRIVGRCAPARDICVEWIPIPPPQRCKRGARGTRTPAAGREDDPPLCRLK